MSASRGGAFCGSLQNTTGGGAIKEGLNAKNRLLMCAQFPNKHTNMVVRERDQRRSVLRQPALDSRAKLGPRAAATPGHRERDAVHLPRGIFELEDELGGVGREQGAGPLRLWGLAEKEKQNREFRIRKKQNREFRIENSESEWQGGTGSGGVQGAGPLRLQGLAQGGAGVGSVLIPVWGAGGRIPGVGAAPVALGFLRLFTSMYTRIRQHIAYNYISSFYA